MKYKTNPERKHSQDHTLHNIHIKQQVLKLSLKKKKNVILKTYQKNVWQNHRTWHIDFDQTLLLKPNFYKTHRFYYLFFKKF